MDENLLLNSFLRFLQLRCTPAAVRAIDAGGSAAPLWKDISDAGFADALVPEDNGGAGLSLKEIFPLLLACGAYALPMPLGETMLARAILSREGRAVPDEALTLKQAGIENEAAAAVVTATQIAGAMTTCLDLTLAYADGRRQFGKPIGKFQAIQHQVAVMAEQVVSVRLAVENACASCEIVPDELRAGTAKAIASQAVPIVTGIAHAVHGAIGMAAEYDLQIYTTRLHRWRNMHGGEQYWQHRIGAALLASSGDFLTFVRTRL